MTLLYFQKEADVTEPVIAKLPGIHADLRGRNVRLGAKPEKVHLFADGKSLLYR